MNRFVSLLYGAVNYVMFLATFTYAICFIGNLAVPKSIDSGAPLSCGLTIAIDAFLLAIFAIQHSVMARQGFKRVWKRVVPRDMERSTNVMAANLALILLLWQWRPLPQRVWEVHGVAAMALSTMFWLGWVIVLTSTFLINHFELFGLAQVWTYFRKRKPRETAFRTPSLYKIVRHPLYLGFVIAFWATPRMTVGHLIFSAATTAYILLGIYFEERDLLSAHGQLYRNYRLQVPMLLPFLRPAHEKDQATMAMRMLPQREIK